jgi:hypothetical protein
MPTTEGDPGYPAIQNPSNDDIISFANYSNLHPITIPTKKLGSSSQKPNFAKIIAAAKVIIVIIIISFIITSFIIISFMAIDFIIREKFRKKMANLRYFAG